MPVRERKAAAAVVVTARKVLIEAEILGLVRVARHVDEEVANVDWIFALVPKNDGFARAGINQIVERPDTESMRGAVAKVPHLLRIVE